MKRIHNTYILLVHFMFAITLFSCSKEGKRNESHHFYGGWEFKQDMTEEWLKAKVPGSVHQDLLEHNLISDPYYRYEMLEQDWIAKEDWTYQTTFDIDPQWLERSHIELSFKGLDNYAVVILNGEVIFFSENAFIDWTKDVKAILKERENILEVHFHSPQKQNEDLNSFDNGDQAQESFTMYNRTPAYQYDSPYGPEWVGQGITDSIKFHLWDRMQIKHLYLKQVSLTAEKASIQAKVNVESDGSHNAELRISNGEGVVLGSQSVSLKDGLQELTVDFDINNPKLWWTHDLGEANLYEIKCELIQGGLVQELTEKIGLRNIVFHQDANGSYFVLNGIPIATKGANLMPLEFMSGLLKTNAYETLITNTRKANMNMLRVNGVGKYQEDVFYDLCDENGILVWQDFMFTDASYPLNSEKFMEMFLPEAKAQLIRLRNHPSIALWNGNAFGKAKEQPFFHTMLKELVESFTDHDYLVTAEGVDMTTSPSYPSMIMIETYTEFDDRYVGSYAISTHLSQATDDSLIYKKIHDEYHAPYDFNQYIYLSQLIQAKEAAKKLEKSRASNRTQVLLTDQLNDYWPGISRSSIDYFGNWKALQYQLKNSYKPIIITSNETDGMLQIDAVNDTQNNLVAMLRLQLKNFDGVLLKTAQKEIQLSSLSSIPCTALNIKEWLSGVNKNNVTLEIDLLDEEGNEISKHLHYFVKTKELELVYPQIPYKIDKKDGYFEVEMFTNTLVKDLWLSADYDGFFEKNYFDFLPNDTLRIRFYSQYELDSFDTNAIHFNSIADSYIEE